MIIASIENGTPAEIMKATVWEPLLPYGMLLFKKFSPALVLRIDGIPDLETRLTVRSQSTLRHDSFQVAFADEPKEIDSVSFDVVGVQQHCWPWRRNRSNNALSFDEWAKPQVLAVKPEHVKDIEHRLATPAHWPTLGVQYNDLAIEHSLALHRILYGGRQHLKALHRVAVLRQQATIVLRNIGHGAESIHLQLEEKVLVVKDVPDELGIGRTEYLGCQRDFSIAAGGRTKVFLLRGAALPRSSLASASSRRFHQHQFFERDHRLIHCCALEP